MAFESEPHFVNLFRKYPATAPWRQKISANYQDVSHNAGLCRPLLRDRIGGSDVLLSLLLCSPSASSLSGTLVLVRFIKYDYIMAAAKSLTQIPPPTINGPPVFEKVVRVQQETQEQFTLLLPLLWIFGVFVSQLVRALLAYWFFFTRWASDGECYLVQVACVVALVWIFSRALFSGLHAQEKPTKSDEHYALWAEKYHALFLAQHTLLFLLTTNFIPCLSPNRLSTAMPRILVLVLLLISSYHFLLSLTNSLLRVLGE
jgi:hypothetical protein